MYYSKIILIVSLGICSLSNLFAQEPINNPYQPPVFTQSSPEVSAFKRYGDVPVSLYTGVPDISIPLYTVKLKDMEVPIGLSYHAGGITVDQEATIVGLGWSLMAGGNITVSQVGARDIPGMTGPWNKWQQTIDYVASSNTPYSIIASGHEDWYSNFECVPENSWRQTDELALSVATVNGMGEQDVYTVSLPHRSFKFFLHPATNEAVFIGDKNKCKINYSNWNFTITDEYGVRYSFTINEEDMESNQPILWYMTKMTDVYGNEINFEYQTSQYAMMSGSVLNIYERMVLHYPNYHFPPPQPRGYAVATDGIANILLKGIETNTEKITFTYQEGRKDVEGKELKGIEVIDKSDNSVKKQYRLNYGYFESSNVGASYFDNSNPYPAGTARDARLKLTSLSQVNPLNSNDTTAYVFTYDERHQLPPKASFAKDFWGYYNGQENASDLILNNNRTLLPDPRVMQHIETDFGDFNWKGWFWNFEELKFANRFSDREYMSTGTIKSITYPTGGRTEFEFGPHSFQNQKMFEAVDQSLFFPPVTVKSVSDMNDPYGYSHISEPFELNETTEVNLVGGGDSTLYNLSSGSIGIIDLNGGPNYVYSLGVKSRWDVKLTLPAGSYRLVCGAPVNIPFQNYQVIVWAHAKYRVFDRNAINAVLSKTEGIGGGLRVEKIIDYDKDGRVIAAKVYKYERENGGTSGRMLRRMDNFKTESHRYGWVETYQCDFDKYCSQEYSTVAEVPIFSADNILPVHNATSNAIVGYDRVAVRMISETGFNGEEISYFRNEIPGGGAGFELYNVCTNGTQYEKIILTNLSDTVRKVNYHYAQSHYSMHRYNMKVRDKYIGPTDYCASGGIFNPLSYIGRYHITVFAYTNFVNQLIKTETYDYSGSTRMLTTTENVYDATNYQLDQTSTLTSDNQQRVTQYKYPHDYPDDLVYPLMVGDNMINPVIEQKEYLDDKLLKTQENKFWFWIVNQIWQNSLSRVKIAFGDSAPEDKIFFDKYDQKGNVLQYHKPDENINMVFYRGHGDNRVVAKIVGEINYDQVSSTAATYLDQLDDNLTRAQLESVNTTIRNLLPNALITTYTYDPLFGITSETDPNGRTTYYEYDGLGRLILMKDHDESLLKQVRYNYYKQYLDQ